MNNKLVTVIAVIALVVGGLALFKPAVVERIVEQSGISLGGSYTEFTSRYLKFNGITHEYRSYVMPGNAATTTVCALQSPTYATSTLDYGSVFFNVSSTTAATVATLAKADTRFATTTVFGTLEIPAGNGGALLASSTPNVYGKNIFTPGQWLVVGVQGGGGGAASHFSPTGRCDGEFIVLP